jgi:hypothetical protein
MPSLLDLDNVAALASAGEHVFGEELLLGGLALAYLGKELTGAYLNQLGLSGPAVFYITNASPNGMQWLTFSDAQNYGIDVKAFSLAGTGDSSVKPDASIAPDGQSGVAS